MTGVAPSASNLFAIASDVTFLDAVAAIIILDDGRYLMQLRDDKPEVFYPGHWGLFGGSVDEGEQPEAALRRELMEELNFQVGELQYFSQIEFDLSPFGGGHRYRMFYEVPLAVSRIDELRLGEGQDMAPFEISELLLNHRVAPYDSFALWMHTTARIAKTAKAPRG